MIPETALPLLRGSCRTLQVIVMTLATGVCVFAIIAIVRNSRLTWEFPPKGFLGPIFLLLGVAALVGSFVVPALLPAPAAGAKGSKEADGDLAMLAANAIQVRTIIGCALLEGGAFANLIAVVMHGYGPSLVLAAVLMSLIVLRFPTWSRYLEWIEAEIRRLDGSV